MNIIKYAIKKTATVTKQKFNIIKSFFLIDHFLFTDLTVKTLIFFLFK